MGLWSKLGLFVAFLITVGYIIMLSGVSPTIQPRKTAAPDGFDPSQYQTLIDLKSTDQMHVANLNGLGDPFHPGFLVDPPIIYISVSTGPYDAFYVFFDAKGREIGRHEKTRTTFPLSNVFVDIDGYYTIAADGIGEKLPYVDYAEGAVIPFADLKKIYATATKFYSISFNDSPRDSVDYTQKINTYVMLLDGVWTRAKSVQEEFLTWKGTQFRDFHTQYRFPTKDDPDQSSTHYNDSTFFDDKYTIYQTWFDEQEYFRRRAASIGSTTGIGRAEHWRGTGYYEVSAGDKTLRFKIPNDRKNLSGSGRFTMKVMGHAALDLILIERYAGNDTQYFIVSTKD